MLFFLASLFYALNVSWGNLRSTVDEISDRSRTEKVLTRGGPSSIRDDPLPPTPYPITPVFEIGMSVIIGQVGNQKITDLYPTLPYPT